MLADSLAQLLRSCMDLLGQNEIPGLEPGGYFDTMINNTQSLYYCALLVSLGALSLAWIVTEQAARQRRMEKKQRKANAEKLRKELASHDKKDIKGVRCGMETAKVNEIESQVELAATVKDSLEMPTSSKSTTSDATLVDEVFIPKGKLSSLSTKSKGNPNDFINKNEKDGDGGTYEYNGHVYNNFEIGQDDEVVFTPFMSPEEDEAYAKEQAEARTTKYFPLDKEHPAAQIDAHLDRINGLIANDGIDDNDDLEDFSDAKPQDLNAGKKFVPEDYSKYITPQTLVDDPRESPSRRGTIFERVKKARNRHIRNQLEKGMTAEDHVREKMVETQCVARIWQIMREDKENFGNMTLDDVKDQMAMYQM